MHNKLRTAVSGFGKEQIKRTCLSNGNQGRGQGQGPRPINDLPILMINAIITGLTELSRAYVINTKHIQHIGDILPVGVIGDILPVGVIGNILSVGVIGDILPVGVIGDILPVGIVKF